MKRLFFICILALINSLLSYSKASAQTIYKFSDKVIGGNGSDIIIDGVQLSTGHYLLAGHSDSQISGNKSESNRGGYDYWMLEMGQNTNVIWDKTFGGFSSDYLYSITVFQNSILLAGMSYSSQEADKSEPNRGTPIFTSDYWFIKTNLSGTKIFDKTFGTPDNDGLVKVIASKDNYYLIGSACSCGGGDMTDTGIGHTDIWIIKTDTFGVKIWDKNFGGINGETPSGAIMLPNGNIVIAASSNSSVSGTKTSPHFGNDTTTSDYWIFCIDTLGNQLWDKSYGGDSIDVCNGILLSPSRFLYLFGYSRSGISGNKTEINKGDWDRWILKTDLLGNIIWQKDFGANKSEGVAGFTFSKDYESILVTGQSSSDSGFDKSENNFVPQSQSWLLSIDTNGNKLWDKTVRSNDIDIPGLPFYIDNHCFYYITSSGSSIGGDKTVMPVNNGLYDFWTLKYCEYPNDVSEIINNESVFSLYPNPATGIFQLNFQTPNKKVITVLDLNGRKILTTKTNEEKISLDLTTQPKGVYFIKVVTDIGVQNQKLILQ